MPSAIPPSQDTTGERFAAQVRNVGRGSVPENDVTDGLAAWSALQLVLFRIDPRQILVTKYELCFLLRVRLQNLSRGHFDSIDHEIAHVLASAIRTRWR